MDEFKPITPRIEPYINFRYADLPDDVKLLVRTPPVVSFTDLDDPLDLSAGTPIRRERGLTRTEIVERRAATSNGEAQSFPRPGEPYFLVHWDALSPTQRLQAAQHWDLEHDPAYEDERQNVFDLVTRIAELEREITALQVTAAPTASDLIARDRRLSELRHELDELRHELDELIAPDADKGNPSSRRAPTKVDERKFRTWAEECKTDRGSYPTRSEVNAFVDSENIARQWGRDQHLKLPAAGRLGSGKKPVRPWPPPPRSDTNK